MKDKKIGEVRTDESTRISEKRCGCEDGKRKVRPVNYFWYSVDWILIQDKSAALFAIRGYPPAGYCLNECSVCGHQAVIAAYFFGAGILRMG